MKPNLVHENFKIQSIGIIPLGIVKRGASSKGLQELLNQVAQDMAFLDLKGFF
jgi:hypothetical protein